MCILIEFAQNPHPLLRGRAENTLKISSSYKVNSPIGTNAVKTAKGSDHVKQVLLFWIFAHGVHITPLNTNSVPHRFD